MAKAITGGYGGLGATITTTEIAQAMEYASSYYSTYGWHPFSVEAAILNIQFLLRNQKQLEKNTAVLSQYFYERLKNMKFKYPVEIRIKGLAIGVKFKNVNYASSLANEARKKGVLLSLLSDKELTLFPALNIDKKVAKKGLDIIEQCL